MNLPPTHQQALSLQPQRRDGAAKSSAIVVAILVHALIFLLLTFIVLQTITDDPPELVVESQNVDAPVKLMPQKFTNATKPNPSAPSMASAMVVSSMAPSLVTVPAIEDTNDFEIGLGDDFGAGLGIGAGGGGGGGVGFFGSRSTAERVIFIVDTSGSLDTQQFTMIKDELTKSLTRLTANIEYQVLFFAGATWFAGDEVVSKTKQGRRVTIKSGREEYVWDTSGNASDYSLQNRKDLPKAEWKKASKANLHKTKKHIEEVQKMYGTDWEWPLKVALEQMDPKPDVIYFLTDGVTGGVEETLEEVKKLNRRGKKAKINTISMMQPRAADALRELAKEAGGKLTIVNADGTTTEDSMRTSRKKPTPKPKKKK